MAFLTDRTLATGVTLQDLIHIVITGDTSQGNFAGASYKATIQQVSDVLLPVFTGTSIYETGAGLCSTQRIGVGSDASGDYSVVGGGCFNSVYSPHSTISGGYSNTVFSGPSSFIGGGFCNITTNQLSVIVGGSSNLSGCESIIVGGISNYDVGCRNFIGGGLRNSTSNYISFIGNGICNTINGEGSSIVNGSKNKVTSCYSTISGGYRNTVNSNYSSVNFGSGNTVTHEYSSAAGKDVVSVSACTLHVNYLALQDTPASNSTNNNVLVRDVSTGVVKQRDITSTLNKNYASFYDTGDQTGLAGTELTMSANTSDSWNTGITLSANTRFVIQNPGVYSLAFSAQMVKTGGNTATHAHIWLYQNGLDVPNSASQIGFPSNSVYVVPAWNFFFSTTTPNEYVELKWEINSNVDNQLLVKSQPAAGNVPAIPSLIVTINQVN